MKYLLSHWQDESALEQKALRAGFGDAVLQEAKKNKDILVLNADLPSSLKVDTFAKELPEQFVQTGVAEQNMAGIATGLAHYGKIPFISTFAAFSPGLNYSQIRLAAMSHLNYKVVASHYGLNVGEDGASAQMNADIAMMRAMPGVTIINPCDYNQTLQAVSAMVEHEGVDYLRVTRANFPVFIDPNSEFTLGKAQQFLEGDDITIIATGSVVYESLQVADKLINEGKTVDFLNIHTIKPLDVAAICTSAKKTGKVVVIEEHNIEGGLGDAVASVLSEQCPTPLLKIGVEDIFGESGSHMDLWKKYGLDRDSLYKKITSFI